MPILLSRHVAEDAFVEPDKQHWLLKGMLHKGLIWTNDVVAEFTLIVAFQSISGNGKLRNRK